jgi:hypothetical protein
MDVDLHSKKEIHSNKKFGSHCFCKIKKANENFPKLKCDCWCLYFDTTDNQMTVSYDTFFPVIIFPVVISVFVLLTRQTVFNLRSDDCTFFPVVSFSGSLKYIAGQTMVSFFCRTTGKKVPPAHASECI